MSAPVLAPPAAPAAARLRRPSPTCLVLPCAILFVGAGLRLSRLEWAQYRRDDAIVLGLATQALANHSLPRVGMISTLGIDNGPAQVWVAMLGALAGPSPLAAEWLVALLNVVGIAACYAFGRAAFGRRVGLLAALLLAVSSWSVLYSRRLWGNDMAAPFAALCLWSLARVIRRGDRAHQVLLFVWAALLAQVYVVALVQLPAVLLGLLAAARRRALRPAPTLLGGVLFLLMTAPYALGTLLPGLGHLRRLTGGGQTAVDATSARFLARTVGPDAYQFYMPQLKGVLDAQGGVLAASGAVAAALLVVGFVVAAGNLTPPAPLPLTGKGGARAGGSFPDGEVPAGEGGTSPRARQSQASSPLPAPRRGERDGDGKVRGSNPGAGARIGGGAPGARGALTTGRGEVAGVGGDSAAGPAQPARRGWGADEAKRRLLAVTLAWAALPVLVMLRHGVELYPHYVLGAAPATYVLMALALEALLAAGRLRWVGAAALAAVVAGQVAAAAAFLAAVPNYVRGTEYGVPLRDVETLAAAAQRAAAEHGARQVLVIGHYDGAEMGEALRTWLPNVAIVDDQESLRVSAGDQPLVLLTTRDDSPMVAFLRAAGPSQDYHFQGDDTTFRLFALSAGQLRAAAARQMPAAAPWTPGGDVRLEGSALAATARAGAPLVWSARWTVTAQGARERPVASVFLHLMTDGNAKAAAHDQAFDNQADRWQAGDEILTWLAAPLPANAAAGTDRAAVGLYRLRPDGGIAPLGTPSAAELTLGNVQVLPAGADRVEAVPAGRAG